MFESVDLDTLIVCTAAFVVVLGFQLGRMKLKPAWQTPETRYGRENDGDYECSGRRLSEYNKRIRSFIDKK